MFFNKSKRSSPKEVQVEASSKKAGFGLSLGWKKPKLPKIFKRNKKGQQKNMQELCAEINDIIVKIETFQFVLSFL